MAAQAPARASKLMHFLGARGFQVVSAIPDNYQRERTLAAIESCADTLSVIDAVDLSPHELADHETPNLSAWMALAPSVRNALLALHSTLDYLAEVFPAKELEAEEMSADDLEAAFSLMAGEAENDAEARAEQDRRRRAEKVDAIVEQRGSETAGPGSSAADVSNSIRTLSDVLHKDTIALGEKLRNPRVVADRWFLLAELHDFLEQSGQCLEAIVAVILGSITSQHLEEVLPRYVNETARAVKLRTAVVDLSNDVDQCLPAFAVASGAQLELLRTRLVGRLNSFSTSPAYKYLRPQDKRAIIFFRIFLNGWARKGADPSQLRQEVEGFSKFLALMRDLNWRDTIAENDRWYLNNARVALESEIDLYMVKPYLERAYGRSAALDEHIRKLRRGQEPARAALLTAVLDAEARLPRV